MNKKYIIPIALAKIVLAFLILQLFFSSCQSDDIFYDASVYSDGALLEIPATFGHGDQIYGEGDTIALEIFVNDLNINDEISQSEVVLDNPTFQCAFCFVNAEGQHVIPDQIAFVSGAVLRNSDSIYVATFGYNASNRRLLNSVNQDVPYFRAEVVFNNPGDYTVYFVNTPNHNKPDEGDVDIAFNYVNGEAESQAYAVYYFEEGGLARHNLIDAVRSDILEWCENDRAFMDFTISGGL